eukprot:2056106-Pyramimonas_sp.AAC.1
MARPSPGVRRDAGWALSQHGHGRDRQAALHSPASNFNLGFPWKTSGKPEANFETIKEHRAPPQRKGFLLQRPD